jgi:hypothetical protein
VNPVHNAGSVFRQQIKVTEMRCAITSPRRAVRISAAITESHAVGGSSWDIELLRWKGRAVVRGGRGGGRTVSGMRPLVGLVIDAEIEKWTRWLSFAEGHIGAF